MTIQKNEFKFPLSSWEKTPLAVHFSVTARATFMDESKSASLLNLEYEISGPVQDLIFPLDAAPQRADGLWKTTCFEAFVTGPAESYYEYNLAPSSQWAFYRFSSYRSVAESPQIPAPRQIQRVVERSKMIFTFQIQLAKVTDDAVLGLSAILEHASGERTHWALVHVGDRPDFHQRASFKILLRNLQKGN